ASSATASRFRLFTTSAIADLLVCEIVVLALWAAPVARLHIRVSVPSELAIPAPLIVTSSTAGTAIAPPPEFTLARSPILTAPVYSPSRGNLNWRAYCTTRRYTFVQRMHVH
ncbi:uncharacterized protein METZ01_LOCUS151989, partial [marine metagenome]